MGFMQLFYFLYRFSQYRAKEIKIEQIRSFSKPIDRQVEIERGTIRHMCAIDSLMTIVSTNNDYDTFSDNGDLELYVEYVKYCNANSKAIAKEELKPYRY